MGATLKAAAGMVACFAGIHIIKEQANAVFIAATPPKYRLITREALGLHLAELPLDVQGTLVSLI